MYVHSLVYFYFYTFCVARGHEAPKLPQFISDKKGSYYINKSSGDDGGRDRRSNGRPAVLSADVMPAEGPDDKDTVIVVDDNIHNSANKLCWSNP